MSTEEFKELHTRLHLELKEAKTKVFTLENAIRDATNEYCLNAPFQKGDKVRFTAKEPDYHTKSGDFFITVVKWFEAFGFEEFRYVVYPAKKDGTASSKGRQVIGLSDGEIINLTN